MMYRFLYWAAVVVLAVLIVLLSVRLWEAGLSRLSLPMRERPEAAVGVQQEWLYDRGV